MKKRTLLIALLPALLAGCGTVNVTIPQPAATAETELTAPPMPAVIEDSTLSDDTLPVVDADADPQTPPMPTDAEVDPVPADASAEGVDAEEPIVTPDMPAMTDENGEEYRNADYRWLDKGVYEATVNGNHGSDFYVFYDIYSGKISDVETGMGIPFACEQTRGYIVFHLGGIENSRVMYITVDDDLNICGTWEDEDSVTYTFMKVYDDPDTFNIEEWKEGRGDIIQ